MLKICGVALIAAVMSFLLSELGFRGKRAFSLLSVVVFLLVFADLASDFIGKITGLPIGEDIKRALSTVLKIAGVGHAFGISSDLCAELSENGIASVLLLIGKLEIAIIILPYVGDLLNLVSEFMKN